MVHMSGRMKNLGMIASNCGSVDFCSEVDDVVMTV